MHPRWPNQQKAYDELPGMMAPGKSICLTSPTGTGKSRMMVDMLERANSATLYTNRKMLLEQTSRVLTDHGIDHGIRAAGHAAQLSKPIQLASIQTTASRTLKTGKWPLPDSELVIIDEAHVNKEATAVEIVKRHHQAGACLVGVTATPLNIGHMYDDLLVVGNVSMGRECGALVPAYYFAPDEPDMRKLRRTPNGDYTTRNVVNAMMTHCIVGRVIDNWRKLNPEQQPTLLFAPGKKESLWFAEELTSQGIPAAHIDGDNVWMDGQLYESDTAARDDLRDRLEAGDIKIVCNRFVLREGIDWPFIRHMVFATIFGALTSFLQSGGRGLRNAPGKDSIIVQDHGGNWYRHGSLNADRDWFLDGTDYIVGEMREQRMKEKKDNEPKRCPKCDAIRGAGKECWNCGLSTTVSSRVVVQHDGTLKEMKGDIYKQPRLDKRPAEVIEQRWKSVYFRCKRKGKTFNQARGLYQYENNWQCPPKGLPFMPVNERDWFLPVNEVPAERLHGWNGTRTEAE